MYIYIYIYVQGTHVYSNVCDGCAPLCLDYVRIICAGYVRIMYVADYVRIMCRTCVVCAKVLLRVCAIQFTTKNEASARDADGCVPHPGPAEGRVAEGDVAEAAEGPLCVCVCIHINEYIYKYIARERER